MTTPFRGRVPFIGRGPFRAHGPFRGLGPFGRPDASLWQTVWHFAQDTYDADPAPAGVKLLVTSANAAALGITVSQGGSVGMTVTGSDGNLTALAVGALPITYERGATQNRWSQSGDFSSSNWTKSALTVSGSTKLVESATSAQHYLYQTKTIASGQVYTAFVLAKAAERTGLWLYASGFGATVPQAYFDLSAGTFSVQAGSAGWYMAPVGGGVYECGFTATSSSTSAVIEIHLLGAANATSYAGDGASGLYVTGAQFNPGQRRPYLRTFATAPLYTAGTPRSQNLANGSGTQTITGLVSGCVYTVLHQAGGTYTLSGATTGSTTAGTATRFVASSTSLTLTASSTPTLLQVYEGTANLAYVVGPYSEYPQAGLESFESRTNSWTYSEQLDNAAWTKTRATVSPNATTAPDGQTTADKLVEDSTASATHNIARTFTFTNGVTYTHSVFAKAAERSVLVLQIQNTAVASTPTAWFDLSAGVVSKSSGTSTNMIEPIGGGWYRCSMAAVATASVTAVIYNYLDSSPTGTGSYTGDGASGLYLWGFQIETGPTVSPYIQAVASTAPRSPTLIRYPNAYLTDGPQTLASCVVPAKAATGASQVLLARGGSNNGALYLASTGVGRCWDGTNVVSTANTASDGVPVVVASRWSGAGIGVCMNGGSIVTGSFDGSMGSAAPVGSGDDPTNGLGFTGLRKWDKSAPRTFNDTDFAKASAGII